jgi:hypothetical protein
MDLLGTFDDAKERVVSSHRLGELARPLLGMGIMALFFCMALGFASAGAGLPQPAWGALVTLTFIGAVAGLFASWKRHGFWLVVIAAALFFPCMGSSSLWDPWETHYGEVSREILARTTGSALVGAGRLVLEQAGLDFWMQAIAMATLGVHYSPTRCSSATGPADACTPSGRCARPSSSSRSRDVPPLQGRREVFGRRAASSAGSSWRRCPTGTSSRTRR